MEERVPFLHSSIAAVNGFCFQRRLPGKEKKMLFLISKYRNGIMGIAILWIMLAHSGFSFQAFPLFSSAAQFIKENGFGGVDIFLFVSGFGLFQSLSHNEDSASFYLRRLRRIWPTYLPVLAVWLLIKLPSVSIRGLPVVLWNNLTGTAFWLGREPAFNWYILALPAFYLVAPAFYRIIRRWGGWGELGLLSITLAADICFLNSYVMIAVSRFTVFALGMIAGKYYSEDKKVCAKVEGAVYIFGGLGWFLLYLFETTVPQLLWNYGLYWYPFIFIAPASVCLLCRLFDLLDRIAMGEKINSALAAIGICSLEIYLFHIKIFERLSIASNWIWVTLMAVAVILGHLYHRIISLVMQWRPEKVLKSNRIEGAEEQSANENTKLLHIEFMRIVACFLVIVNHTEESLFLERGPSFTWFAGLVYFFICKIAVPVFLMIMGAVLLIKTDPPRKAAKRLLRGIGILVVASAVYYIYYGTKSGQTLSISDFFEKVFQIRITNAFWYLHLYIGLLCLTPILQKLVKALNKREIEWMLFLSVGVLGAVPLIHLFIPSFGLSWYFTSVLFSTYIGVLICGYYIEKYVVIDCVKFCVSGLLFVLLIFIQTLATYWFYQKDPSTYKYLDDPRFITIIGSAICFYIMVKYIFLKIRVGPRLAKAINYLGSLTFGMYLFSDLVMDLTQPLHQFFREYVHVILAMVFWELIIFAICAVLTAALKQVPGFKKWI